MANRRPTFLDRQYNQLNGCPVLNVALPATLGWGSHGASAHSSALGPAQTDEASIGEISPYHSKSPFRVAEEANRRRKPPCESWSSAVCACCPPKVHGGAHTVRVLDLLCGVSKQQVARIHAEGHWNALNHAADEGEEDNDTKHSDRIFYLLPISGGETRAHMDRSRSFSWLGLLRMRLVVRHFWFAHWQIY